MTDTPDIPHDDTAGLGEHPLTARRLAKHLAVLEGPGYPYRFERTATAAELHERHAGLEPGAATGEVVTVAGRLMNVRRMGKLSFAVLQDGTGRIQLFVDRATLGDDGFAGFDDLDVGDWVGASGEVIVTKRGELSVRVAEFALLAKALRPFPEKWHGLQDVERRHRRRYLDLVVNEEARRVALTRAEVVRALRHEFERRGFVEVETPVLQTLAGGALARPFVTRHNALGIDMYLRIATELHLKRLVVGGLERVFEIGKQFRNEGIDATHNPEFTTLEAYQAFADYEDIMLLVEEVVAAVAHQVTGGTEIEYQGRKIDLAPPYLRARMLDLVRGACGDDVGFTMPLQSLRRRAAAHGISPHPSWGHGKLIVELFEAAVEHTLWDPVFVIDHPAEVSPLSRRHRTDPDVVERFELYIAGREMCDAFSELSDPLEQRRRFEEQARAKAQGEEETHPVDEDFLTALEYGFPPTGGLGIGIGRLTMLLTDQTTLREVVLFPQLRPEA